MLDKNPILPRNTPLKRTAMKKKKNGVRILPGKTPIRVYRDGREVCDTNSAEGRRVYGHRVKTMVYRQKGICCLYGIAPDCPRALSFDEATFEHENGRGIGGGKRDDRIEVNGKRQNGAAHEACNSWKGSRFIPYNDPAALREWKKKNAKPDYSGAVYLATISEDACL